MIRRVLRRLRADGDAIYECRNCGAALDDPEEPCHECGSEEVAEYELGDD
ncbi:hypothetical protein [Halomicrobium salinisoli]|nr:hypothetical protein [Halomicrobium salinisoli]